MTSKNAYQNFIYTNYKGSFGYLFRDRPIKTVGDLKTLLSKNHLPNFDLGDNGQKISIVEFKTAFCSLLCVVPGPDARVDGSVLESASPEEFFGHLHEMSILLVLYDQHDFVNICHNRSNVSFLSFFSKRCPVLFNRYVSLDSLSPLTFLSLELKNDALFSFCYCWTSCLSFQLAQTAFSETVHLKMLGLILFSVFFLACSAFFITASFSRMVRCFSLFRDENLFGLRFALLSLLSFFVSRCFFHYGSFIYANISSIFCTIIPFLFFVLLLVWAFLFPKFYRLSLNRKKAKDN